MKKQLLSGLICLAALLCLSGSGRAFYEAGSEGSTWELHGFMAFGAGFLDYPADNFLYTEEEELAWSASFRLLADADLAEALHLTANVLQSSYSKQPLSPAFASFFAIDVERSSSLTWEQHDSVNTRSELLVDALNLQYSTGRLDLAVGRQPVNLAATFYFAPNDFFAPFRAADIFPDL